MSIAASHVPHIPRIPHVPLRRSAPTSGPGVPLETDALRQLLRQQATTVTVVTVGGSRPVGFTATSFTSVSLDPPLVSVCLDRDSSSWAAMERARHIAVHLLGAGQEHVAATFATSGIDRFAAYTDWRRGPHGVPLLGGTVAWLVCRVVEIVPAGDHAIVLSEPVVGDHSPGAAPLVYHDGAYGTLDR
ncbi:flavin-dependent reductase [Virgisporangium aliadipatigenens]|uniref:Flavin-dependent reductase n=1 Tax=Virgisporangium aliadipatigenens TaxID=741659 RepID=A0A8J4DW29_9ACTN|nr:flavin reductase family protein [Virgisporangium aliadipatigenens]GIJ52434.1 flavin-dependent reductase [Virgisporangium aliadipatigenens]